MYKEPMITEFIDKGLNNGQLPWKDSPLPVSKSGSEWQKSDAINFRQRQYQVLAPVLGPKKKCPKKKNSTACHYDVPSKHPLPFKEKEGRDRKSGGYGTVTIVTVPGKAHNRFDGDHSVGLSTPMC
jgi:hypothetical protein